jgi:hypothetical protein
MVRPAQFGRMCSFSWAISRQSADTASNWRGPAPGKPTSAVSMPRRSMVWRISIFLSMGGSVTDWLCSPSRSVSSSSMTWPTASNRCGPAAAQS